MGIREGFARIFGRRKSQGGYAACVTTTEDAATTAGEKLLQATERLKSHVFDHKVWAQEIVKTYKEQLTLAGLIFPTLPAEKVCPLTKGLIIQKLQDLSAECPELSIRTILARVGATQDDYELLDRLERFVDIRVDDEIVQQTYDVSRMAHRIQVKRAGKAVELMVDDVTGKMFKPAP